MNNKLIFAVFFIFSACTSILPKPLPPTAIAPLRSDKVSGILTNTPDVSEFGEVSQPTGTTQSDIVEVSSTIEIPPTSTNTPTDIPPTDVPTAQTPIAPNKTLGPPTFTPTNTPIPLPTYTPASIGCSSNSGSSFENQVISLINKERAKKGLPGLSNHSSLASAARGHSRDMACNNFFSHQSPRTGSPFNRINAAGYSYSSAAENIAAGFGTAAQVVASWMSSSGHRNNILNPNFTHTGVGYFYVSGSTYGSYWTQTFGAP